MAREAAAPWRAGWIHAWDRGKIATVPRSERARAPRSSAELAALSTEIAACRRCPRLVRCREAAADAPPRRFAGQTYWALPVPGFGDPAARLLVVGLAPAAHGGNRTGRVFTGDRSGDWLYGALHRAGFANQAHSVSRDDGLALSGAYVSCVVRCAPPGNRPTPRERDRCLGYLVRELAMLRRVRAIVALGGFAWDGMLAAAAQLGHPIPRPRPKFGHGAEIRVGPWQLLASYHVSQQNTFTGRLTEPMLDGVFARARAACDFQMS
jgi:uracil-DNA glycosylase